MCRLLQAPSLLLFSECTVEGHWQKTIYAESANKGAKVALVWFQLLLFRPSIPPTRPFHFLCLHSWYPSDIAHTPGWLWLRVCVCGCGCVFWTKFAAERFNLIHKLWWAKELGLGWNWDWDWGRTKATAKLKVDSTAASFCYSSSSNWIGGAFI